MRSVRFLKEIHRCAIEHRAKHGVGRPLSAHRSGCIRERCDAPAMTNEMRNAEILSGQPKVAQKTRYQRRSRPLSAGTLLRYPRRREPQAVATAMPRTSNSVVATIKSPPEIVCACPAPGSLYSRRDSRGTTIFFGPPRRRAKVPNSKRFSLPANAACRVSGSDKNAAATW